MSGFALKGLLRPELAELRAYLPHAGDFRIRLDANEAPPLLPAAARERLAAAFAELGLERYPDPTASDLRHAIAARLAVGADEVLVGVGSDELIGLLLTVLVAPTPGAVMSVVTSTPSFVMYKMSARVRGQRVLEVPLDAEWDVAADGLLRAIEMSQASVAFIASPNNPTGTLASMERLRRVIEAAPNTLIVIDEAYIDYAGCDHLELYRRYPNVILLRTLSKIGFAALRVGWLVARPELSAELDKARQPYNLNAVSQRLASVVLAELAEPVAAAIAVVVSERERVAAELVSLPGVTVTPSRANFLWLCTERAAGDVFDALCQRGILVRSFHERGGRLAHQLRVTIGTPAENDELIRCLREVT
ncbi:MAG TPA: histidinol-phosphate transaminase [Polyangiaceae bacterium]|nr:histidinol-phosphate transaminase [Polyangiaceae bacterium]